MDYWGGAPCGTPQLKLSLFFNKGHRKQSSTRVPYFRQKFQYSCPIKCPLFFPPKKCSYVVNEVGIRMIATN